MNTIYKPKGAAAEYGDYAVNIYTGCPHRFPTTEAVAEYKELIDLQNWVQEATSWLKVKGYTLAQLREVKRILEGGENT